MFQVWPGHCSPALLYGFILSRSSMYKLLGDGTGRAGLESGKRSIFLSPFFGMAQLMDIAENGDVITFH